MNGQSVSTVAAGSRDGRSAFAFDLACVLETRPYDHDADQEQWISSSRPATS